MKKDSSKNFPELGSGKRWKVFAQERVFLERVQCCAFVWLQYAAWLKIVFPLLVCRRFDSFSRKKIGVAQLAEQQVEIVGSSPTSRHWRL